MGGEPPALTAKKPDPEIERALSEARRKQADVARLARGRSGAILTGNTNAATVGTTVLTGR